ncbi:AraC family transcriptional regulator [Chitinophaga solisilvae]|uniref:AraC family transcriptional regulator n=1 Tax=Chitinophaga solisilvae TaxID=1233460 RepID=UPI00136C158C|nr:AraC family transcriptional regulator [Chitinophaga solisilvae]
MKARLMDTGLHASRQFRVKQVDEYFLNSPFHFHDTCEIVLIEEGYGKRIVGDHIAEFEQGDLVMMGPDLPHIWQNDSIYFQQRKHLRVKATVLYFDPSMVMNLIAGTTAERHVQQLFTSAARGISIQGDTHACIVEKFSVIRSTDGLKRMAVFLEVIDLLAGSADHHLLASSNYSHAMTLKDTGRFSDVYQFLMMNFHRDIPLEEVAAVAKMSPTAFCRYFKARTQKSFVSFLQEIRISHACKLLRNSELSILETALESGYNNLVNFNKCFRNVTSQSPSMYRKAMRKK